MWDTAAPKGRSVAHRVMGFLLGTAGLLMAGCGGHSEIGADSSSGASSQSSDCEALSQAIADDLGAETPCTAVVRLSYEMSEILGFQLICGAYAEVDESAARQAAQDATGYGLRGTLLGEDPDDEFVFYESPSDLGGVGVVHARNGAAVFGASIYWAGTGDITYPTAWRSARSIGPECSPRVGAIPPAARGVDLSPEPEPLDQEQVEAALGEALNTALPDGLLQAHGALDAVVLLYPRSVGGLGAVADRWFAPATAEWIVLINTGTTQPQ